MRFRNVSWRKRVIKFLLSNGADIERDSGVKYFSYLKFKSFSSVLLKYHAALREEDRNYKKIKK